MMGILNMNSIYRFLRSPLVLGATLAFSVILLSSCATISEGDLPTDESSSNAAPLVSSDKTGLATDPPKNERLINETDLLSNSDEIGEVSVVLDETPVRPTIRIAAMGDIMMGTVGRLPDDGGAGSFLDVKQFLSDAQIVFGNLEGPLTDQGACTKITAEGKSYCFQTPPDYARWLSEAGFTMASLANNHSRDFGLKGRAQTIEMLEKYNIAWSGPPGTIAYQHMDGLKAAMIAFYTGSGSNKLQETGQAMKMVAQAKQDNDLVIISFHGGAEGAGAVHTPHGAETYLGENRGDLRTFAHSVIDAGADIVIGHGPHVPRAMEIYKNRLIAYSLGNFCTEKGINVRGVTGYAPLLLADLDSEGRIAGGRIVSFIQTYGTPPKLDSDNRAAALMYQLGEEDFPETNALTADGEILLPVRHSKQSGNILE